MTKIPQIRRSRHLPVETLSGRPYVLRHVRSWNARRTLFFTSLDTCAVETFTWPYFLGLLHASGWNVHRTLFFRSLATCVVETLGLPYSLCLSTLARLKRSADLILYVSRHFRSWSAPQPNSWARNLNALPSTHEPLNKGRLSFHHIQKHSPNIVWILVIYYNKDVFNHFHI